MEYRNIFLANPARVSVQREQLVIEQARFLLRCQHIIVLTEISCHIEINDRAEWFYQVIRKIKLIQFIAMMDANTRFQPMDYQIPCDSPPQNGITIIQCSIAGIVRASEKAPAKQCREINRSSRSLTIIMVIGKDTVRHLI